MRIAATADIHIRAEDGGLLRALLQAAQEADVLAICGDLTDLGRPEEAETFIEGIDACPIPVVATLGNHDHQSGSAQYLSRLISESHIYLLDRSSVVIDGVGFSGVKGFGGGFDENAADSFGEEIFKAFVTEGILEAEALKKELMGLGTPQRVAVLHYAPVRATVEGEPPEIYPFLGTSRLGNALDEGKATVAFHGHAHSGTFAGKTPGGVPVFNISVPVLEREIPGRCYHIVDV